MNAKELLNAMNNDEGHCVRRMAMEVLKHDMMNDKNHSHPTETAEDAKYWKERCIDAEVILVDIGANLQLMKEAAMADIVQKMAENPFIIKDGEENEE